MRPRRAKTRQDAPKTRPRRPKTPPRRREDAPKAHARRHRKRKISSHMRHGGPETLRDARRQLQEAPKRLPRRPQHAHRRPQTDERQTERHNDRQKERYTPKQQQRFARNVFNPLSLFPFHAKPGLTRPWLVSLDGGMFESPSRPSLHGDVYGFS